ncbi:bestrophin family ion channel [Danxiaibacter flavus]|uniref:Bestrophin family ion channel n=1 Tax=Danxiaibacter flavus TaxID=3049108 RepID=A0ABV3ZB04_9BACT|nr:bestrophin family ion channel [Chitinophagaceae bacterium DXS]
MLLKPNLSLYRFFVITWRIDILMLCLCGIVYFVDTKLLPGLHIPVALATLMGTALAFFIAFNNNQAYDRWWEARIIWGGLVNDSRSWSRSILQYVQKDRDKEIQRRMILRHIGFLYALKASLRRTNDNQYKKFLPDDEVERVASYSNIPNAIIDEQAADLRRLYDQQMIDGYRFLGLDGLLKNFCEGMGKSERINNTVFPTTYIYFTRLFIWLLMLILTMAISEEVGPAAIFFGWAIGFVFHISHLNGMNIINPFELKAPAIPLDSITRTIEINLLQALQEKDIPAPVQPAHNNEYIL